MLSLRTFHILFVMLIIIAADMFGAWAVWDYRHHHDSMVLTAGILSFAFSFGVIAYAIWLVRKLDRAHIE